MCPEGAKYFIVLTANNVSIYDQILLLASAMGQNIFRRSIFVFTQQQFPRYFFNYLYLTLANICSKRQAPTDLCNNWNPRAVLYTT